MKIMWKFDNADIILMGITRQIELIEVEILAD